jgi:putative FmdB family regulatory protein
MPTYQYICDNCKDEFETYQSINDEPLLRCEKCDCHQLRRIISGGIYTSVRKSDSELTLGHLADRNRSRFSEDQKEHLAVKNTPAGCKPFPKDFGISKSARKNAEKAKDFQRKK